MSLGLDDLLPFGKYKGEQVEDVLMDDREYIVWLAENTQVDFDEEVLQKLERK